jgi:transforming growth factor-beta-induced protein
VTADLVGALSAVGQRTVFAPTDAAFAELGLDAGNIGTLPKAALTNILLYHVAPGRRLAADVVSSNRIRMSNGGFTTIRLQAGEALINDSRIVLTDVEAANGVIHVIDAVLLP